MLALKKLILKWQEKPISFSRLYHSDMLQHGCSILDVNSTLHEKQTLSNNVLPSSCNTWLQEHQPGEPIRDQGSKLQQFDWLTQFSLSQLAVARTRKLCVEWGSTNTAGTLISRHQIEWTFPSKTQALCSLTYVCIP